MLRQQLVGLQIMQCPKDAPNKLDLLLIVDSGTSVSPAASKTRGSAAPIKLYAGAFDEKCSRP
jgi:hypothetical protein